MASSRRSTRPAVRPWWSLALAAPLLLAFLWSPRGSVQAEGPTVVVDEQPDAGAPDEVTSEPLDEDPAAAPGR